MPAPERKRCAERARELGEGLAGSAPFAARWELVEREKPWGHDHGLTTDDGKVLLVHHVAAARGRKYLVCTNGARDPCCAVRGAAVVTALARAGRDVWECSHLGGHRFAANVLVLPDALCFGYLDARSADELARELEAGRLPLDHLRGRTTLAPEAQAAEIHVRRELGLTGLDDARRVEGTTFDTPRGRVTVRQHEVVLAPRRVSCRDEKTESPSAYELVDLVFA